MNAEIKASYHIDSEPSLWRANEWAQETPAKVRVIQTCVGPYGAIDQKGGTTYFDVGDHLVYTLGKVVVVSPIHMAQAISETQESSS